MEGLGASLVLPALAALIAGNFEGPRRKVAYAVIGGLAGAGIAIGPILGGWATTELTWRVVFVGEVFLVLFILAMTPKVLDAPREGPSPKLDYVGSLLSASALGVLVYGVLQSSSWGWLKPKNAPFTIFGFSPTLFVIAFSGVLIWSFVAWQRHRETTGHDPLVHLSLVKIPPVRSGLIGLFSQNLILMGIFFVIPLYLQLVLGLSALETGIKMLPVSITMLATSAVGSRLSNRFSVRGIVRTGLLVTIAGGLILLSTIRPTLANFGFGFGMAVLGVGMGLLVSQLGNVVQSSVESSGRSEAGGLQYTGQQLGSSLGVALIGAIVLMGLAGTFISTVEHDACASATTWRLRWAWRRATTSTSSPLTRSARRRPRPASIRRRARHWSRTMRSPSSARSRPVSWRPRSWPCCRWPSPESCRTTTLGSVDARTSPPLPEGAAS